MRVVAYHTRVDSDICDACEEFSRDLLKTSLEEQGEYREIKICGDCILNSIGLIRMLKAVLK